jgi:hypothetical protein
MPAPHAAGATGTIDAAATAQVIRNYRTKIRQCYNESLTAHLRVEGKVSLRIEVDPSGAVTKVTARETTLPTDLVACLTSVLSKMTFPAPDGGPVVLEVPLAFHQEADPDAGSTSQKKP